jgi:CDGSH-type Zn-finger protein
MTDFVALLNQYPELRGFLAALLVLPLLVAFFSSNNKKGAEPARVNTKIKLDTAKVVDFVKCPEMEDMAQYKDGKLVMCRCWKSETFPYCDGSHVKHNKDAGDNVGPLIIQKL